MLGRRDDGYHRLDSIVAFADLGERLVLTGADKPSLAVAGPEAGFLGEGGNLVLAADRAFRERFPGRAPEVAYRLDKRIPVAAGLGGGSADAAAALRGLARLAGLPVSAPEIGELALQLGADVPVCLASRAARMTGIGETVEILEAPPPFAALLVNPRAAVATADVFAALGLAPGAEVAAPSGAEPGSAGDLHGAILIGRNDLEPAARRVAPVIAEVIAAIAATRSCLAARMSGSGATCFGLYEDFEAAAAAAAAITSQRPDWWAKAAALQ